MVGRRTPQEPSPVANHPELEAEQRRLDQAYDFLDEARRGAAHVLEQNQGVGAHMQSMFERDVAVAHAHQRLAQLTFGDAQLCFGRLDYRDARLHYIGRVAVTTPDQEPYVLDWRAPASAPFYRATAVDPMGVARRRHFHARGRTLVGIDDEVFDFDASNAAGLHLVGEGALLASLARTRTGRMHDIVGTIQAEQDEAIRAPLPGILIVQGGPGTGKTAVALHRAAYLLYTHRQALAGTGVLVIGPNRMFLRYISNVLPSLGEDGVVLSTPTGMASTGRPPRYGAAAVARVDPPRVTALKGDARMARVLTRALADRQRILPRTMVLNWRGHSLRLTVDDSARIVNRVKKMKGSHNERRFAVAQRIVDTLLEQHRESAAREVRLGLGGASINADDDAEFAEELAFADDPEFQAELFPEAATAPGAASGAGPSSVSGGAIASGSTGPSGGAHDEGDGDERGDPDRVASGGAARPTPPSEPPSNVVSLAAARRSHEPIPGSYREALAAMAMGEIPSWYRDEFAHEVLRTPEVREALFRMWPDLEPAELLYALFTLPVLLARAAEGVLSDAEQQMLLRRRIPDETWADARWSEADTVLLDELTVPLGPRSSAKLFRAPRPRRQHNDDDESSARADEPREFGHVIVDEAQDLTPMQWRMLARRCPAGSFTLVGDFGQASRPGACRSWDEVASFLPQRRQGRNVHLSVNYRTPAEIVEYANRVLSVAAPHVAPTVAVRSTGEFPRIVTTSDAVAAAASVVRGLLADPGGDEGNPMGTVAVVAPAALRETITAALADVGAVAASADALDAPVAVLSPDEIKGLEFDAVVLVEPAALVEEVDAGNPSDGLAGLRALFVTLTRATRTLALVHERPLPDPL
jgi:DNA helicase IV